MFLGNKGEKKHFFLCMFLGLLIPSPNNLGSYRHRECCFLCSAVANSNDNEGEDTTHPLLYTNFGRDAAYRNSLFGFKLQRPIATPWQRSTQKGFVRLWLKIISYIYNVFYFLVVILVCWSKLYHPRLVSTEEFVAVNGQTPITRIRGFSPWRPWACIAWLWGFLAQPARSIHTEKD